MAVFVPTNTFGSGAVITASGHNTNWSDVTTWLNNRYNGSDTWSFMKVSSTDANPVDIVSSGARTELSLNNTATDGDPILTWKLSGTQTHILGVDDSDSDALCGGTTGITTNQWLRVPSGGAQAQFNVGTVGAPGISFIGDPNTGIYNAADEIYFSIGGSLAFQVSNPIICLRDTIPNGTGSLNLGSASNYWGDISYKTLTDRGCLGWFDEGVELQDGTVVSDCDALLAIKKHPTKKTVYGIPMLDYRTFPKVSYKKADKGGDLLPRDKDDEPIGGQDGIEMTSMQSIMIGALKELHKRLAKIEDKVA